MVQSRLHARDVRVLEQALQRDHARYENQKRKLASVTGLAREKVFLQAGLELVDAE